MYTHYQARISKLINYQNY